MPSMRIRSAWIGGFVVTIGLLPTFATATPANSVPRISVNPPVNGGPGGRSPGGSRSGDCLGMQQVAVLNPTQSSTTATHPSFTFQVPPTSAKTAVFVLQNGNKQVYKSTLNLSNPSGVVNVNLPSNTTPGLEVGKNYRWVFSVVCSAQETDKNPFVQGWVKRVK